MDDMLKQPTRAKGGEPCVKCGNPIPAKAHWKQRDRHVCSPRCNANLRRSISRTLDRPGTVIPAPRPEKVQARAEESARGPQFFRTNMDAEFPYEHGRWPKPGDAVERHGLITSYALLEPEHHGHAAAAGYLTGMASPDTVMVADLIGTDMWGLVAVGPDYRPSMLTLPVIGVGADLFELPHRTAFLDDPETWFARELISDVDEHGNDYRWEAYVFSPVQPQSLWTPARHSLSRAARARSAYLARARAAGHIDPQADYVDPQAVYEACDWMCGICGTEIDKTLQHPDPWSVTLDHIQAVTVDGGHTAENLQAAHWWCNVIKGNS